MLDIGMLLLILFSFLSGLSIPFIGYFIRLQVKNRINRKSQKTVYTVWKNLAPEYIQGIVKLVGRSKEQFLRERFGKNLSFASQYGEDIFLAEFFQYKPDGFYIEIGAYDGVFLSNTYLFEQLGWKGILVEPLPDKYQECVKNRPNSKVVHAAVGYGAKGTISMTHVVGEYPLSHETLSTHSFVHTSESHIERCKNLGAKFEIYTVPYRSFDEIVLNNGFTPGISIDLISIDCEGMDFEVIKSIDLGKWQPRILIVESNDKKIKEFLNNHGYLPALRIQENTLYCRSFSMDCDALSVENYWRSMHLA